MIHMVEVRLLHLKPTTALFSHPSLTFLIRKSLLQINKDDSLIPDNMYKYAVCSCLLDQQIM